MSISIDASDLMRLVAQLDNVKGEIPKGTRKAVETAAHTVKEAWRAELSGSEFPASSAAIEYKLQGNASSSQATVENSQGTPRMQGFVHAAEYGSPSGSVPGPRAYAQTSLQAGAADLEKGLSIAGQRAIERALGSS